MFGVCQIQGELRAERQFCLPAQAGWLGVYDAQRAPIHFGHERGESTTTKQHVAEVSFRGAPSVRPTLSEGAT